MQFLTYHHVWEWHVCDDVCEVRRQLCGVSSLCPPLHGDKLCISREDAMM